MTLDTKVADFMTSFEHLICADESTTLKEANDIIWEHKLNSLPIIDKEQHLLSPWYSAKITILTKPMRMNSLIPPNAIWWGRN